MTSESEPRYEEAAGPLAGTPSGPYRLGWALLLGPILCVVPWLVPAPLALPPEAWRLTGLLAWIVLWWMTEAVPLPVTSLLPLPLMPLLGIASEREIAASYAHPLIFLFLGGFFIAAAMQRWALHRRIALTIVAAIGTSPARIVGGFMLATAGLSMWISNTATAVMMASVGTALIAFLESREVEAGQLRPFAVALLLGIAYAASIGGVATLIGTPPNALLASVLSQTYGIEIGFAEWMLLGVPVALVMIPLAWLALVKLVFRLGRAELPVARAMLAEERARLGPMGRGERAVLIIFVLTAVGWILRKPLVAVTGLNISDTGIAMMGALAAFMVPVSLARGQFVLDWETARRIPWGVLLLFGGGLAIATAFRVTGLADAIGHSVGGLGQVPIAAMILIITITIVILTELTSNTATTATFLPILAAVAIGLEISPLLLCVPVALAASMAFMMPVATPPNAIVFAYSGLRIGDMLRAGLVLNIIAVIIIYAAVTQIVPRIFSGL